MKYGLPLPQRLQKFQELLSNKQGNALSKFDVPTMNGTELYEVYQVSIELPKYRLDNTRTLALQEQYIYTNQKNEDFFSDVESNQVQEIQHDFLKSLITSSDKDKDLLSYFEKHTQTEPLILTHDGFVISGNRRLCAFRELLGKDFSNHEKYKHFSQVRVVILPNLDQDQIDRIEDLLEQQTDIKESFSWVSRALGYRRRIHKYKYSDETLASITGLKKSEIRSLIDKLEIADRYLESINKPKDYNQILDDYYAFEKIYACESKDRGTAAKKMAFEKLAFISIKNKGSFSDRMYKNIPIIFEVQSLIHEEIKDKFSSEIDAINQSLNNSGTGLGLSLDPDETIGLIKFLETSNNEEAIVEIVSDRIEEYLTLEREKKKKSSVLDRVAKANTLLVEANTIKSHETNKTGVLQQIQNIEREIIKLKSWVSEQ
jgi:hypothetical protein